MVVDQMLYSYLGYKGEERRLEEENSEKVDGATKVEGETMTEEVSPISAIPDGDLMVDSKAKTSKTPARNQFNYSERATQTVNNPLRVSNLRFLAFLVYQSLTFTLESINQYGTSASSHFFRCRKPMVHL
jgi:hypothetical protein